MTERKHARLRIVEEPWRRRAQSFVVQEYVVGFGEAEEGVWVEVCARVNLEVARGALQRYCEGPRVLEEVTVECASEASADLPAPTKRSDRRGTGKKSRRPESTSRRSQRPGTR